MYALRRNLNIVIFLLSITYCGPAAAVRVEESTLSEKKVNVILTSGEVEQGRTRSGANVLGLDVGTKMILLAGIPESVTGKVAAIGVWSILREKYATDINRECKKAPEGNTLTLSYRVDIEGVRSVWEASKPADLAIPGSQLTNAVVSVINELINSSQN